MDGLIAYILAKGYTDERISALGTPIKFKGVVDTFSELPTTGNEVGDLWVVRDRSAEYIWVKDGETNRWEMFGSTQSSTKTFPPEWNISGTTKAFCSQVNDDASAQVGDIYIGGVEFTDLPGGLGNAEASVSIFGSTIGGKVVHIDLYSATTSPYYWSCNYFNGNVTPWKASIIDVKVNGASVVTDGVANITVPEDETDIKLSEDLYTYAPIGVLQTEGGKAISSTNPKLVANEGESLKKVFNSILGTATDSNPTINQSGTNISKSGQTGTINANGAEIGTSIAAQTGVITYTVTNTATCSYGLKTATYDTYNKKTATTFNYPVKTRTVTLDGTQKSYQVKIAYPALGTGYSISVTTGTEVGRDATNRYLYCNLSNGQVAVSVQMPAVASSASAITRLAAISADVQFDNATYNGETVTNFWTYLKNSYTSSLTPPARGAVSSAAYTVTAGTRYAYSKVTSSSTTPTGSLTRQAAESTFATSGADFSYNLGDYIYLYRTVSGRTVETYVLGQWAAVTATALGATTITQANGATCTYYPYRVGPMEASGSAKYRV